MEKLVYELNGKVVIAGVSKEVTWDDFIKRSVKDNSRYVLVEKSLLPDVYFIDAWVINSNGTISIDEEKAKTVHLERIRKRRHQKFIEMGFPFKLNTELENGIINEETREILQSLRDIPQQFNAMSFESLSDIKEYWPTILN